MSDQIACQHCGEPTPARNTSGSLRKYCSLQCSADQRGIIRAQRRKVSRASHEANLAAYENWLAARRKRLGHDERWAA